MSYISQPTSTHNIDGTASNLVFSTTMDKLVISTLLLLYKQTNHHCPTMVIRSALLLVAIAAIALLGFFSEISSAYRSNVRALNGQLRSNDATSSSDPLMRQESRKSVRSLESHSIFGRSNHIDNLLTSWGSVDQKALPIFTQLGAEERQRKGSHKAKSKKSWKSLKAKHKRSRGSSHGKMGKSKVGGSLKNSKGSKTKTSKSKGSTKGASTDVCDDYDLCSPNILDTALDIPSISIFMHLLDIADLTEVFSCRGPFTMLVPSNDAFNALDPMLLIDLMRPENKELLQVLLLYHIIPGLYLSGDLKEGRLETLSGDDVFVSLDPTMFNDASVESENILACNGVIYIIDSVLSPAPFGTYAVKIIADGFCLY
jgi:uncharacterized surface protein with fasciclin (FAS1) repeats